MLLRLLPGECVDCCEAECLFDAAAREEAREEAQAQGGLGGEAAAGDEEVGALAREANPRAAMPFAMPLRP
eukprot:2462394-Rhodomonas_salina.1